MARDLPAALTDVFTPVVIFGMSCFVRTGKQKEWKGKRAESLLFLKWEGLVMGKEHNRLCLRCLSVNLSLSGSKRNIVCSILRLLSGWASGTNLNINSHIKEVSKKRNQERELWDWNPSVITWVNVAGFHHSGSCIIQGRLMSRYQVLVQRKWLQWAGGSKSFESMSSVGRWEHLSQAQKAGG